MMQFLIVFLGGGIGSMLRYGVSRAIPYTSGFPHATLIANVLSSFLLGILLGFVLKDNLSINYRLLLITGLCGGFSTFSTFSMENYELWNKGEYLTLGLYIGCSLILGIGAILIGVKMTS